MREKTRIIDQLQDATTTLKARTETLLTETSTYYVLYNHAVNSRNSILARGRMCSVVLYDDFTIASMSNAYPILGPVPLKVPIADAIRCPAAREYFDTIRHLRHEYIRLADLSADSPWTRVFPGNGPAGTLENWIGIPDRSWDLHPDRAQVVSTEQPGVEHYLVSPAEIIGPTDDFRIEYTARAAGEPRDLSLIIGRRLEADVVGVHGDRPDADGYCFGFGAMENRSTELQRSLETLVSTGTVLAVPGRDHHCVAERVGGQLRFAVDDRLVYSAIDALPLIGPGRGYVGFYSCGPEHSFSKFSVWTRPTCLPTDLLQKISRLRVATFQCGQNPQRTLEVHYLGKTLFLFRDITPTP